MLFENFGLALAALFSGLIVSMGVFSVLVAVSLVPRFAGKTDTAKQIFWYEDVVVLGILAGIILSVFTPFIRPGQWFSGYAWWDVAAQIFLGVYGIFTGMFVGSLAVAIAEMLDAIPIFARRISFEKGIGIAILCFAFGKVAGSFLYFVKGM